MLPPQFSHPVLLGTSNVGKLDEIGGFARILGFEVQGINDPSLKGFGKPPEVPETADTYEGNARLKACAYSRWASRPCIADDTGLEIPALGDLPGVYTAPWGPARVAQALGMHVTTPARFVCCMVYSEPNGRLISARGSVEGELRNFSERNAFGPLPFSKFFYPNGFDQSMATLLGEGFRGSHRFLALEKLVRVLS